MNDQSLTTEHNASSESMEESHALIMGFRKAFIAYLLENTPQNEDQRKRSDKYTYNVK